MPKKTSNKLNTKPNNKRKILALIDGNALVHRAYHALPPLTTKEGKPSGAVYGFALTLFGMMDKVKPDYIIASFDVKGPTFRHKEFKEYKANRKKAPDDLYEQIPVCQELLKSYGVPIYIKEGFEADDILGTISKMKLTEKPPKVSRDLETLTPFTQGVDTLIVTGDMDLAQLVDKDTSIFTLRRGVKDTVIYDEKGVMEKYGIRPDQIVDYKALRGDPSDNIPGVKGVGEKTALDLLHQFGHLKDIYDNLDKIEKSAVRKKLEENKEEAFLSYKLATIATNVPLQVDLGSARVDNFNKEGLAEFLKKMGFQSLYKRLIGGAFSHFPTSPSATRDKLTSATRDKLYGEFKFTKPKTKKDIERLVGKIKKQKQFSYFLDFEGTKFYNAKINGVGLNVGNQKTYYLETDLLKELKEIFIDKKIRKNGYGVKFDLELLGRAFNEKNVTANDLEVFRRGFFDVKLAGYLLGQTKRSDLEKEVFNEFGETFQNDDKEEGQASLLTNLDENKQKLIAEKAGWVGRLTEVYENKFTAKEKGLASVFNNLEMPLEIVLAKMELNGIKVDRKILDNLSEFLKKKLANLEKKIYKLTGEEFNINSPSQLAEVLFQKLKLPTADIKRGKTGYSTDAEQLEKLRGAHPVIKFIEEYRVYAKLKSTYADPLPELIQADGRIHTTFNQTGAITGRLSSSEPNLQNIPKYGKVSKLIRQSFVVDEKKVLVSADYSQIDLRVAAHLSQDPKMMEIFREGKDIHRSTAAWVNNLPLEKVTDEQRSEAKSLNFGILYGMGTYGFMRDSGVSQERAEFFIKQYMKTFSKLKEFLEKTKEQARKNGFVETEFGRRRYLPNIKSGNYQVRSGAERAAVNFPMQGLAADIMKLAMLKIDEKLLRKKYRSAKMELQIHDEVIVEIDETQAEDFGKDLKEVMENVYKLRVPLVVEVSTGKNWGEL